MILKKINIVNYKNIQAAGIGLAPKINCLIGHNGVGKTNFLDAVYYLSFCRSAFSGNDTSVITHDREFMVIEGCYDDDHGDEENVYVGMKRGARKHVKRNKKEYKKLSEHIGLIPLIMFSPADVVLIDGGSDGRRRLMDVVISQYDHPYIESLSRYNKALQQRNALLKQEQEPDPSLMDIWEEEMATQGESVYAKRKAFIDELIPVFQEYYQKISGDREKVSLGYISHCQRGPLLEVIRKDRFKDRAVGYSLHGIHRDDMEMLIGGFPVRREGSQGQTKTFALSLKLAQYSFLRRTMHTAPLLLLDDIFDKLDADRVEQIIRLVSGDEFGQIFITDTNREHLDRIVSRSAEDYRLFTVDNGEIKEAVCETK